MFMFVHLSLNLCIQYFVKFASLITATAEKSIFIDENIFTVTPQWTRKTIEYTLLSRPESVMSVTSIFCLHTFYIQRLCDGVGGLL